MERDFRLFVKNLPINITKERIKELFEKHLTVNKVDLKEKKDFDDKVNKFSFINVTATDKSLNSCVCEINGKDIDGSKISVELAKESFLERLKKERDQHDKPKKEFARADEAYIKNDSVINNDHNNSLTKHKKFTDLDLITDVSINKEKKRKKYKENDKNNLDHKKFKQENFKVSNHLDTPSKEEIEEKKQEKMNVKFINEKPIDKKNKSTRITNNEKVNNHYSENNESEKRLMIAKEKRRMFKLQKQTIQDALKNVDGNKPNKKIVFDENIKEFNNNLKVNQVKSLADNINNNKKDLFDSDDEDENKEYHWNEDELNAKADLKYKLSKFKVNTLDKRFTLDERFVDEDDKTEKNENLDHSGAIDEKKWQLNILEEVLGKSIKTTDNNDSAKKKYKMIRYDPSDSSHQKYEVIVEKSENPVPKKKKKISSATEVKDEPPAPVSAEVFYDVSDTLIENLKKTDQNENEKFSLFKCLGRETPNDEGIRNKNEQGTEPKENFQFKFSGKNPFKHDSTDDEIEENTNQIESTKQKPETIVRHKDVKFFTDIDENDPIVLEAKQYFQNISTCDKESFKHQRRELKEILRLKNKRHLRKTAVINRKKVWKVNKKRK